MRFFFSILLAGLCLAQGTPKQSAGGKWIHYDTKNDLTDEPYEIFVLDSDNEIKDGPVGGMAQFLIMCGSPAKPHWINSKLLSPVVIGVASGSSVLDQPQQTVILRADKKMRPHFWNIDSDSKFFFVDKGATRELIRSQDARIEYRRAIDTPVVAIFSPHGLDHALLANFCGATTFK